MENKNKYTFGVMSSKYTLEANSLPVAKITMCLFIKSNVPIVIYSPEKDVFRPMDFMSSNSPKSFNPKEVQESFKSVKKII